MEREKMLAVLLEHLTKEYVFDATKENSEDSGSGKYRLPNPWHYFGEYWRVGTMEDMENDAKDYVCNNLCMVHDEDMERIIEMDHEVFLALSEHSTEEQTNRYYREIIDTTVGIDYFLDLLITFFGVEPYILCMGGELMDLGGDLYAYRIDQE